MPMFLRRGVFREPSAGRFLLDCIDDCAPHVSELYSLLEKHVSVFKLIDYTSCNSSYTGGELNIVDFNPVWLYNTCVG